jgi:S1/P1 Nuclease
MLNIMGSTKLQIHFCIWGRSRMLKLALGVGAVGLALAASMVPSRPALAWGDEGHKVVALVAQAYLEPAARKRVAALLAADTDTLTAHDIAAEATWADKYRDANEGGARARTREWHFVDIELSAPSLDQACFGHPPVPPGALASNGPAHDCVVDKVREFAAELAGPGTPPEEQVVALKFLLHLVGDVYQPLHASDDHDRGGNDKRVSAPGFRAGNLHHYWDTEFVNQLGPDPQGVASDLIESITQDQVSAWSRGGPADWAQESFALARDDAYGQLPQPTARGSIRLSDDYVTMATQDVATQLGKAGVRLAMVLNQALGPKP